MGRPQPVDAARQMATDHFPSATVVLLAGSVVAGRETTTSDLDVVIILDSLEDPYRRSLLFLGWPVEAFVHSEETLGRTFDMDVQNRNPAMLRMWSEGVLVADLDGTGERIKSLAASKLASGCPPPSKAAVDKLRYEATSLLEDLEGDPTGAESLFVAPTLCIALCHLRLLVARAWIGTGKWRLREAQHLDAEWTQDSWTP